MLTGIGLRNFKAFGDEVQEAPLSKITLIYGPNSGGKSSIIQALLLLKQSLKNGYGLSARRALAPRGELVDFGSSLAILHKHEAERNMDIEIKYKDTQPDSEIEFSETTIGLTCLSNGDISSVTHKIVTSEDKESLVEAVIKLPDGVKNVFIAESDSDAVDIKVLGMPIENNIAYSHYDTSSFLPMWFLMDEDKLIDEVVPLAEALMEYVDGFVMGGATSLIGAAELAQILENARTVEGTRTLVGAGARALARARTSLLETAWVRGEDIETDLASELELERALKLALGIEGFNLSENQIEVLFRENTPTDYERHLNSVNYLGPLRSAPERLYDLSSESDTSSGFTGVRGEHSANVLARDTEGVEDTVNRWFRRFEIPYDIHARKLEEALLAGEFITIELMPLDKEGNLLDEDFAVTLADVGYGINQILPVIIEGIASQEGSILCVEQPEIHLHPRLQANIADLMIDTIADEPGKRKQWIVETHSELLITRLQRRIREGKISPDDISVLYVDPSEDNGVEGSAIIRLEMDENGDFIDHWPHGFFDEAFNELMAEPENQLHPAD